MGALRQNFEVAYVTVAYVTVAYVTVAMLNIGKQTYVQKCADAVKIHGHTYA